MHVYMHPRITLHSSWDIMHAFSFDLRSSRKQSSLTAGELKENLIEEIKAIYREVNPEKADIPQLLEYYNGQELELYKRVCEKYNVQPKERYGSILTSRRRRRQRSQSDERPQPMASRPPMTPGSGVAPVDSDVLLALCLRLSLKMRLLMMLRVKLRVKLRLCQCLSRLL